MRKTFLFVIAIALILLYSQSSFACGDKFLVIGRGIRYERAFASTHPGSILVYADSDKTKDLREALKLAGHKVQIVSDENSLFSNLQSGHYDVVIVNLSDAALLQTKILATPSKPTVVPVIY